LNASDDRGIDIIRNQINQFVNSKSLFNEGMKFVILDEVDYMTKNAQQALRYLLQNNTRNVRFCLICNYISRIDEGLKNEFLRLRFNQLPEQDIILFLTKIIEKEGFNIDYRSIEKIQQLYKSDIRSMINFIQANQIKLNIIDNNILEDLYNNFVNKESLKKLTSEIQYISTNYNIDKKNIIKIFLNYIIKHKMDNLPKQFLVIAENIMHNQECKDLYYINYAVSQLQVLLVQ
jgi:replication factor C subunit 3/5